MPSVIESGFTSKEQEEYLKRHQPDVYHLVMRKHGSFKPKPVEKVQNGNANSDVMRRRGR